MFYIISNVDHHTAAFSKTKQQINQQLCVQRRHSMTGWTSFERVLKGKIGYFLLFEVW